MERTPIEIALEMTEDGKVSAKKLYAFLELAPSQYARWCTDNITENPLVKENIDWEIRMVDDFRHDVEYPLVGGRKSTDYLLTVEFAKELCMTCKTEKGREAREYFKKTEQALVVSVKEYNKLLNTTNQLTESFNKLIGEQEKLGARVMALEGNVCIPEGHVSEWFSEAYKDVQEIVSKGYYGNTFESVLSEIVNRMGTDHQVVMAAYAEAYMENHPNLKKKPHRLYVIAEYDELRTVFDIVVAEMTDYGCSNEQAEAVALAAEEFANDGMFTPSDDYVDGPAQIAGRHDRPWPPTDKEYEEWETEYWKKFHEQQRQKKYWDADSFCYRYHDEELEAERQVKHDKAVKEQRKLEKTNELFKKYHRGYEFMAYFTTYLPKKMQELGLTHDQIMELEAKENGWTWNEFEFKYEWGTEDEWKDINE